MRRLFGLIALISGGAFLLAAWLGTAERRQRPLSPDTEQEMREQHVLFWVSGGVCLVVGTLLLAGVRIGPPGPLMARGKLKDDTDPPA